MSEPTESTFVKEVKEEKDQNCRPQTVSLSKLRQEYNSTDESENESDEGIGEAFFSTTSNNTAQKKSPKQSDGKNGDSDSTTELKFDKQNSGLNEGEVAIMNQNVAKSASPQLRPKTVTTKRSDERKQQLLDMGAVSIKDAVVTVSDAGVTQYTQTKSSYSPKPKADNCYICGKTFLVSSLKIHEKQCAKKFQRENEKPNTKDMRTGRATPSSEKTKGRLNYAGKSPASTNCPVLKIPRKLKLEACYLCGQEFFAHSLGVHETQCIKNWKASKTPEAPPGKAAEQMTSHQCVHCEENIAPGMEVFHKQQQCVAAEEKEGLESGGPERARSNKAKGSPKLKKMGTEVTGVSRAKGLKTTPCYMCGMQFLPHSLKVHEKKCGRKQSGGNGVSEKLKSSTEPANHLLSSDISTPPIPVTPALEHSAQRADKNQDGLEDHSQSLTETAGKTKGIATPSESSPRRTPKRPRTVLCYTCGQEFLKSSLAVHEKQCANKIKPTEQAETEQGDDKKSQTAPGTRRKPEALGDSQKESAARKPKTQQCFICGKEMLLSSLNIHEQQCQKKAEILKNINQQKRKSKSQQKGSRQGGAMPKTQVCYVCGGAFLTSSIKVHEAQCEKRWNTKTKT